MIKQWIIVEPFNGYGDSFVTESGGVAYSDLSLEEYLSEKPNRKLISDEEFTKLLTDFHETKVKSKFVEVTQDQWEDSLECLPPLKWHTIAGRWNVFYISEATTAHYHALYVKDLKTQKCYSATKSILLKDDEILADIEKEINTEG